MNKILLIIGCWLIASAVIAQQRSISGKVTDQEDGAPLPGVSVVLKGTTQGTVSAGDGSFSINAEPSDVLIFSFIGFADQEITVGNRTTIDVVMVPSIEALEEVVVIGYGEKSRALLTESIGTVNARDIQQLPVASPDAALQGRVSGVQITNVSGAPGSPVAIRIRGVGTVGNTAPLFVIDGVPVTTSLVNDRFDTSPNTNIFSSLNPADIESISVLKDASAAAVYGVRAANGVVLITTKRGKTGRPKISVDTYYGVQSFPRRNLPKWNNTQQYVDLAQEAMTNRNQREGWVAGQQEFLSLHPHLQAGSPYLNVNTDWQDAAINDNAPITNSTISVAGGGESNNYFVSAGYFKQEAIVPNWEMERFTFRANSDYMIGKRFKFGQTLTISHQDTERGANNSGDGMVFSNSANMPPFFLIYEDPNNPIPNNRYGFNGNLNVAGLTVHNMLGMNEILDNSEKLLRLIGGIYGELEIISGLKFRSAASLDFNYGNNSYWNPGYTAPEIGINRPQTYQSGRTEGYTQVFTNTLSYSKTLGEHNFNLLVGYEYQKLRSNDISITGENFISTDPAFYVSVKNASTFQPPGGSVGNDAYAGIIGRLSYDYQGKYLLTASVRRDGTAHFAESNRYGTFPSVSAAWRISDEAFFENVSGINDLKLRASWGQLGNSQTTPYPHLRRYSVTPDYGVGNTPSQGPVQTTYVNPNIKWETVETLDFGFDISLLQNKINFLATYYNRKTKDFLFTLPVPIMSGFPDMPVNAGEVSNKGIELELGYNGTISEDFIFTIAGNFSTVKNRLESLAPGIEEFNTSADDGSSGSYRTAVGYPIGYFYGYRATGVYQNAGEAAAALPDAVAGTYAEAGDVIFEDNNGPAGNDAPQGQQFSGQPDDRIDTQDRTYLGKTIPGYFYGLSINASYKNFDLAILFQGQGDFQIYNQFQRNNEDLNGMGRNEFTSTQGRWTGEGTSNSMPRAISGDPYSNNRFSSRWIEDGDFLRLRNVQIGYTIPSTILGKTNSISRARIYIAVSNLAVFTNYSGIDPEVVTYGNSSSQREAGTDEAGIPQPRTIQAGLQLEF
jgi:TonB-dependent starch-binding outer membrane protein SusC